MSIDPIASTYRNVKHYGAKGDGTTNDFAAISAAIASVATVKGTVYFPPGVYRTANQIVVPDGVRLLGNSFRSTVIKASLSFPVSTYLVRLGDGGSGYAFGALIENIQLDCQAVVGSGGVYSTQVQEMGGVVTCRIRGWRAKGIFFDSAAPGSNNFVIRDCELWGQNVTGSEIGVDISSASWKTEITNVTVSRLDAAGPIMAAGIQIGTGQGNVSRVHVEYCTDAVLLNGSTNVSVRDITAHGCPTVVHAAAGNLGRWSAESIYGESATTVLKNDNLGHTIAGAVLSYYRQDGGANSFAQTSTPATGVPSNFTELTIGRGQPMKKHLHTNATLDFGSIPAGGYADLTVSLVGANGGNTVQLGPPATIAAGLIWCGWVSAADVVTVRLFNATAAPIDPAAGGWRVAVTAH